MGPSSASGLDREPPFIFVGDDKLDEVLFWMRSGWILRTSVNMLNFAMQPSDLPIEPWLDSSTSDNVCLGSSRGSGSNDCFERNGRAVSQS